LASAQTAVQVTSTNPDGTTATTTLDSSNGGPAAQTPAVGRYWDSLASTNYYNQPPYIAAPPNPQIAVGPDDIFVIVNRTLARYPNPNAGGAGLGTTVPNPYLNPPTELVNVDTWLGLQNLAPQAGTGALCPSGTGNNATCVIDNLSTRYDQMQGRFVVLMTVTDLPAHRSNFVVVVSRFSQFTKCSSTTPAPQTCPASSPLFSPPVIAPIVGGTQTGGTNSANWVLYKFPLNLTYRNDNAGASTETSIGVGRVSTPNSVTTGGTVVNFLTTPFCSNGGPLVTPAGTVPNNSVLARTCTNYFPTGARMGFDNDNMIISAPVLDLAFGGTANGFPGTVTEGTLPFASQQIMGPFAGTRVVTVPKLMLYNGTAFSVTDQPPTCSTASPISCLAVNLADDVYTGTLTNASYTPVGGALTTTAVNPALTGCAQNAPPVAIAANLLGGGCAATTTSGNILPAIFWEPDNLRGRALASFDAQVAPFGNLTAGVVTPFDYLVGTRISGNYGSRFQGGIDGTSGIQYFLQPIIFSCPGIAIFPGPSGVSFCGATSASQVADLPVLGILRSDAYSQLAVSDPAPVGQGFSAQQLTTNPANVPVSGTANSRLFVGDSRPQQVMFREGLLYVARTVRNYDLNSPVFNALSSSTVLYELLKTCAASLVNQPIGTNGNSIPNCGSFSATGTNVTSARSAMSGIWTYATNVGDPLGNIAGFGFYQPMFDSPADVVNSQTGGPTPPINTFPWLENVFVGMTTGGTSNVAATFSKNYPSLWDFRPGDDAYDTIQPYLDPYTGIVQTTVPCPGDITVLATVTRNSTTINVADATGLQVGMYATSTAVATFPAQITSITPNGSGGATIVLSSAYTGATTGSGTPPAQPVALTFSLNPPGQSFTITQIVAGSNQITVNSTAGLVIGQTFSPTGSTTKTGVTIQAGQLGTLYLPNTTGVGVGEVVTGNNSTAAAITAIGSNVLIVPSTAAVAPGEGVTGTGIPANTTVSTTGAQCAAAPFNGNTPIVVNPNDNTTLLLCLTNAATASAGITATFTASAAPAAGGFFTAPTFVSGPPTTSPTTAPIAPAAALTTGTVPPPFGNGISVTFTANYNGQANSFFTGSPQIVNISGNTVTLDRPATFTGFVGIVFPQCTVPAAGGGNTNASCSGNLPASVITSASATLCPMIPFSARGGASTDPNDGSLWLYGEFAKNRLSSIPGPGQWGTAVANYPLNLMATDTYYNDNTFFQDVQPGSTFFTWIQIAKNVGLAQPSLTGPCTINNGGTPILTPPLPGTTPTPGQTQLICPYFGPDTIVTRAEMAYWVVRSQMDEAMVSAYLCATGGDPTGLTVCPTSGGQSASTFADTSGVINPFISVPTLGFPGVTTNQLLRYIEVMSRRGYTKGCGSTNDPLSRYCPNDPVKRQEMAVFLIRAKMNNVFPTQLSGIPLTGVYGDNFGLFQQTPSYFSDVTSAASDPSKDYYIYVQKMRELRITNGTSGSTFSPTQSLTRKEIATFVIRAFFL
jgi:hypothetical protein